MKRIKLILSGRLLWELTTLPSVQKAITMVLLANVPYWHTPAEAGQLALPISLAV